MVKGKDVKIGKGSKIWNLVYIGDRTMIGENVTIGSLTHIDHDVVIGDDTMIEGCAYIPPLSCIGKNCFVGPNVSLTNDIYPPIRRRSRVKAWSGVTIEDEAIIGGGACIRAGVTIGKRAVVGMGSVVIKDVPPETVVAGNPARQIYTREEYDRKMKEFSEKYKGIMAKEA